MASHGRRKKQKNKHVVFDVVLIGVWYYLLVLFVVDWWLRLVFEYVCCCFWLRCVICDLFNENITFENEDEVGWGSDLLPQKPLESKWYLLFVDCCALFVVCCSLFVVHSSLFVVPCPLFVVCCSLFVGRWLLFVVRCSLFVVRCSLFAVRC